MEKPGLLLMNLGSPQAPTRAAVKTYLTQFLTDKYVIDLPYLARQALVRAVIVPLRAQKSAEAYQKIWRKNGSPLVHYTREFAGLVRAQLADTWDVRWAMRYGEPSIASQIRGWRVKEIFLVPLYPQFAESSSQTALDIALEEAQQAGIKTKVLPDFFDAPEFIQSETRQIQAHLEEFKPDHLIMSFHGLPEHHLTKLHPGHCLKSPNCCAQVSANNRHCYRAQAFATARAIQKGLQFDTQKTSVSFQSRLGRRPWIKPYTDLELTPLIARGVRRVLVTCPSFVADCLETLEEIQMRLREQFIQEGGLDLKLIPALNAEDFWVDNFCKMIRRLEPHAVSNV